MNVAFDIDDTITRHTEFFSFLSHALKSAGHHVFIITFREASEETLIELDEWGVVYDEVLTLSAEGVEQHGVDEWKAAMCREREIDVFFEDDPEVLQHVDESVMCLMPVDKNYHILEVARETL